MKLIAHPVGTACPIRPAPLARDWMDEGGGNHPYRCLPLNIANCYGWEVLCPSTFAAVWHGGQDATSVQVRFASGHAYASSHFGYGTVTFHTGYIFRTPPGYDLMVQGPINRPKDVIAPLCGIVETDWVPFSFTMNWRFTRPGTLVKFEEGEPFCHIFPVKRGELEAFEPEVRALDSDPDFEKQYRAWSESRSQFNRDKHRPGSEAGEAIWQRYYQRGLDADGRPLIGDHRTRLRLKPFEKR